MTVEENLLYATEAGTLAASPWRLLSRSRYRDAALATEVLGLLELGDVAGERAADLPTGRARVVELGRALCGRPSIVLLDEPSSGLDGRETELLAGQVERCGLDVRPRSDADRARHVDGARPVRTPLRPRLRRAHRFRRRRRGDPARRSSATHTSEPHMTDVLLRVSGVRAGYGGGEVLHGIDLEVARGRPRDAPWSRTARASRHC